MLEQIVQIRVALDLIDAAGHQQRQQVGARLGAARIVPEEPCCSAGRKVFDLLLAVIVVDWDLGVIRVPDQLRSLAAGVPERLAQRTVRSSSSSSQALNFSWRSARTVSRGRVCPRC